MIQKNSHRSESQIAATKIQLGFKVEDLDDFAVHNDESLYLKKVSELKWCKDLQTTIVNKAQELLVTLDHVIVLLFNEN